MSDDELQKLNLTELVPPNLEEKKSQIPPFLLEGSSDSEKWVINEIAKIGGAQRWLMETSCQSRTNQIAIVTHQLKLDEKVRRLERVADIEKIPERLKHIEEQQEEVKNRQNILKGKNLAMVAVFALIGIPVLNLLIVHLWTSIVK